MLRKVQNQIASVPTDVDIDELINGNIKALRLKIRASMYSSY
jgi:hypothetical protein